MVLVIKWNVTYTHYVCILLVNILYKTALHMLILLVKLLSRPNQISKLNKILKQHKYYKKKSC